MPVGLTNHVSQGQYNTIQQQYNTNKIYIAPGILKRIGAQTHGVTRR